MGDQVNQASDYYDEAVTGETGELLDRLIWILDREPVEDPHWWFNLSVIAGGQVGVFPPGSPAAGLTREQTFGSFRAGILRLVEQGISEALLVRGLAGALEEWLQERADTGRWDADAEVRRAYFERILEDPAELDAWRLRMGPGHPNGWQSDEEVRADIQKMLDESTLVKKTTAEDAAERWSEAALWRRLRDQVLADAEIKEWTDLHLSKQITGRLGEL